MGTAAGILGIGGGGIAVPLLQRVCNLPLRQCIGTSTAVMCITAGIGALRKNLTLHQVASATELSATHSLTLAMALAPTAVLGGWVGARLTHRMPLTALRIVFVTIMSWAALNLLGVI